MGIWWRISIGSVCCSGVDDPKPGDGIKPIRLDRKKSITRACCIKALVIPKSEKIISWERF
jgi:hypothetical protein